MIRVYSIIERFRTRWWYVTYPINIDQERRLLVEMYADLLAVLHKPDENKKITQEKITEALKAISSKMLPTNT